MYLSQNSTNVKNLPENGGDILTNTVKHKKMNVPFGAYDTEMNHEKKDTEMNHGMGCIVQGTHEPRKNFRGHIGREHPDIESCNGHENTQRKPPSYISGHSR
jgi:hypothetical protein